MHRLVIIGNASHLRFAERPAEFNTTINSFLDRTDRVLLALRHLFAIPARAGYERRMLRGELIGLRAQQDSDLEVFETELLNDVGTRLRADSRPWRPVAPGSADSPYRGPADRDNRREVVKFAVVELATGELAGEALLWAIDMHNRSAHLGLSLRPAFRGKHLGTHLVPRAVPLRLRHPRPAPAAGRYPGRQRRHDRRRRPRRLHRRGHQTARGLGQRKLRDEVILGQLASEWLPAGQYSGR